MTMLSQPGGGGGGLEVSKEHFELQTWNFLKI